MLGDMAGQLTKELLWLTLTCILTGLIWIPYVLDRVKVRGLWSALDNPSPGDKPQSPWAQRLYFAHTNAVDNLAVFAPLVIILNLIDYSNRATVYACAIYFWARLAHVIVYGLGLPVFRTLVWTVGFLCQIVLVLAIFRIV